MLTSDRPAPSDQAAFFAYRRALAATHRGRLIADELAIVSLTGTSSFHQLQESEKRAEEFFTTARLTAHTKFLKH